jgi:hypothetical protein
MKIPAGPFPKYRSQHEYFCCQHLEGYRLAYTERLKFENAYDNIAHDSRLLVLGILKDSTWHLNI